MSGGGGLGAMGGGAGKALLSWRVALLPFLGEQQLYEQFKLDEPWDSPHNQKLLKKIPKFYIPPGEAGDPSGTTFYQVFVGDHAAFEKHRNLRVADFLDGTSNTLLIVEAGHAVPWTKPEDLHYAADEPLPQLGGLFADVFNAAFADSSVFPLSKKANPDLLRKAITRDDGFPIDVDQLRAPTSGRAADLQRETERLRQEVEQARRELEELRRQKDVLQEEDADTLRLKAERVKLEQLLRQTRDEVDRLREEIRQLKQTRPN
jgi:hypothetical protein